MDKSSGNLAKKFYQSNLNFSLSQRECLCYNRGMKIKSVKLKNFRNYASLDLKFDSSLVVLTGKNAQGKTNIVEAIYFAALGKSFRISKDKEIIKWNEEYSKAEIEVENRFRSKKIEFFLSKNQKKAIKIDKLSIKRIGELLGELTIVFFSPDELRLIKDSPEERRRFRSRGSCPTWTKRIEVKKKFWAIKVWQMPDLFLYLFFDIIE